jgi:hypothetical protein
MANPISEGYRILREWFINEINKRGKEIDQNINKEIEKDKQKQEPKQEE